MAEIGFAPAAIVAVLPAAVIAGVNVFVTLPVDG